MNYNDVLAASYAGAQVINLSWTSGCSFSQYIQDVINEVYDNGTFIVAAAGNGFTCGGPSALVYPSACDNVFAVTSIGVDDNHEQVAGDSTSTHQHNATVDLCAPGYDVPISDAPGWYLFGSGTSYAAPFVTGTVGLMLSVNPCLSNLLIEQYLEKSADFIYLLNPDYYGLLGEGRLNSRGAVTLAANSYSNTQPCLEIPTKSADVDALNLKVYPNPSNGIFNITVGGDEIIDRVEIYNNMGQQIISKFNASSFEIDLTQESTGVYFVRAYIYDEVVSSVVSLF
jgi:subtilisin family serine protease